MDEGPKLQTCPLKVAGVDWTRLATQISEFSAGSNWFTGVDSVKVLRSQIASTSVSLSAELPNLPHLAWTGPFPLGG